MESIYSTSFTVPPHDIDFSNRLKISALFNYIQTMASEHAEQLQLGYQHIHSSGIFWVLSWVKIEIDSLPRYQDPLTATTWPHRRYRVFSLRDFNFSNGQEQVFARARSAWLLVDAASRRVANLDRLPRAVPYLEERGALEALPEKIIPPAEAELIFEKHIRYTDLDLNQHTNNARYVDFMLDGYSEEFHRTHHMRSLTFSFQCESKFGDHLLLYRQVDPQNPGCHHLRADRAGDERTVFQAIVDWTNDIM